MSILPEDIKIESYPPRAVGGQHVGTGPNGILITHHPSQISVGVNSERSQHRNKELAILYLEYLLEVVGK